MSQQLGASRMTTQFSAGEYADEKLQEMLTLYKSPATIRDMKQTFFYVSAESNTTDLNPLVLFYNIDTAGFTPTYPNSGQQNYYAPIGTTRTFNIADKVNDLMDIRVPKDKYVVEINLAECVIEADPEGYAKIEDRVIVREANDAGNDFEIQKTFKSQNSLSAPSGDPSRQTINSTLQQATKLSQPQTLYTRIKELDNGQPYNWAVTNSGAYSIDKSHQLLVRHGDIDYNRLTLEFGHMAFQNNDGDYDSEIIDASKNAREYVNQNAGVYGSKRKDPLTTDKEYYRQYKYYDYNREYFNTITSNDAADPFYDTKVANIYKGDGGIDYANPTGTGGDFKKIAARNIIQPAQRVPAEYIGVGGTVVNPYWLQGKPLFYNQQASRIGFRFLIRIIHTF